jgi:hypothetical protein
MINGAKKPACKANSASAFPEGRRQLMGSIHSMGRCGIAWDERFRPAAALRALGIPFISGTPLIYFGGIGGFH